MNITKIDAADIAAMRAARALHKARELVRSLETISMGGGSGMANECRGDEPHLETLMDRMALHVAGIIEGYRLADES